jgi:hypothetical protein
MASLAAYEERFSFYEEVISCFYICWHKAYSSVSFLGFLTTLSVPFHATRHTNLILCDYCNSI